MKTIGLANFRRVISSKTVDTGKLQIRIGPHIDKLVANRLTNAIFGIEGIQVFPSIFQNSAEPNSSSMKPNYERIQSIISSFLQVAEKDNPKKFAHMIARIAYTLEPTLLTYEAQEQVTSTAGWKVDDNDWIEVSASADLCLTRSAIFPARENPSSFTGTISLPMSPTERDKLVSYAPFRCFRGGGIDFYCTTTASTAKPRFMSLGILDASQSPSSSTNSLESYDSCGLMYIATTLINQSLAYNIDTPQIGYFVTTNGHLLRIQAFQLNTLTFFPSLVGNESTNANETISLSQKSNQRQQQLVNNNASWIYETELYSHGSKALLVNPEAIQLLQNILFP